MLLATKGTLCHDLRDPRQEAEVLGRSRSKQGHDECVAQSENRRSRAHSWLDSALFNSRVQFCYLGLGEPGGLIHIQRPVSDGLSVVPNLFRETGRPHVGAPLFGSLPGNKRH